MYFFDVDGCLRVLSVVVCLFVRCVVLFVVFAVGSVVGLVCVFVVVVLLCCVSGCCFFLCDCNKCCLLLLIQFVFAVFVVLCVFCVLF